MGLISDIEKVFLDISVGPELRDFLRFLWVDSLESLEPKIVTFRYNRSCLAQHVARFFKMRQLDII